MDRLKLPKSRLPDWLGKLQAQGGTILRESATTAIALKRRKPSETALNTATRSAHSVSP